LKKLHLASRKAFTPLVLLLSLAAPIEAGTLFSPQVNYTSMSFRPLNAEDTPNYLAYGLGISGGYSAAQVLDLAVQGFYYPSKAGSPKPFEEDVSLYSVGGEIALRVAKTFYIGIRGGNYTYHFLRGNHDDQVLGRWIGPGGGIAVGGIVPQRNKGDRSIQLSLEMETSVLNRVDHDKPADSPTRKLDLIKFCISYVYNGINKLPMFDTFVGELF
jgi:hypothetical protein